MLINLLKSHFKLFVHDPFNIHKLAMCQVPTSTSVQNQLKTISTNYFKKNDAYVPAL